MDIEGVIVLSSESITISSLSGIGYVSGVVVIATLILIVGWQIIAEYKHESKLTAALGGFLILSALGLYISGISDARQKYWNPDINYPYIENHYEVQFYGNINFDDFNQRYEIMSVRGDTFKIKERISSDN